MNRGAWWAIQYTGLQRVGYMTKGLTLSLFLSDNTEYLVEL